jgi:hypothetical protein
MSEEESLLRNIARLVSANSIFLICAGLGALWLETVKGAGICGLIGLVLFNLYILALEVHEAGESLKKDYPILFEKERPNGG